MYIYEKTNLSLGKTTHNYFITSFVFIKAKGKKMNETQNKKVTKKWNKNINKQSSREDSLLEFFN